MLLALLAPHLDRWLSRATSIKGPYLELQLAAAGTHKISIAEGSEKLIQSDSFDFLVGYDDKIKIDKEFLKKYGGSLPDQKALLESAETLYSAINNVLSPIAKCIQEAIDKNWLSVKSAQQLLTPTVNIFEQIVLGDKDIINSSERDLNTAFWQNIIALPKTIPSPIDIKECKLSFPSVDSLPLIRDYKNRRLPYLYVAGALLISFIGDNDKALQVLNEAHEANTLADKNDFSDLTYLWILARLRYYHDHPGPIRDAYLRPLTKIHDMARSRIKVIESAKEPVTCTDKDTADNNMLCRYKFAELTAINIAAFYITEDIARGNNDAKNHKTELQGYVEEIKRSLDELEKLGSNKDGFYRQVEAYKYDLLDTYAFATLVLEASKPNPDYDVITKNVIHTLEKLVEDLERDLTNKPQPSKQKLTAWRLARAHLMSATDFVGEQ